MFAFMIHDLDGSFRYPHKHAVPGGFKGLAPGKVPVPTP